ncbi:MAG: cell division protein FtsL [Betaproteobacteria bacterium]|nr:cell division protein FtsL [Rhodocyclales bacterium]
MARLNLLLIMVALACALSAVGANHRARKLVTELDASRTHMRGLEEEWGQLQLEQSTLAAHVRVEKAARDKLGMKPPAPGQIISVDAVAQQ